MTKVPQDLLDAASRRCLIPFVGAGLSASFELPTWSGLVDLIADGLDYDPEVAKLHGDFLQIAEYYNVKHNGIGELRSKLDRLFNRDDIDVTRSAAHMALPALRAPAIYTTNWDNLIERAFRHKDIAYNKIVTVRDLLDAKPNLTNVVKFHGDFSDDLSLVFTESDYFSRLAFESPLDILLRADLLRNVLLFVGYSFSDLNIRYMWYRLMKALEDQPDERTLAYIVLARPNPILSCLSKSRRTSVIELDSPDPGAELDTFFKQLVEAARHDAGDFREQESL